MASELTEELREREIRNWIATNRIAAENPVAFQLGFNAGIVFSCRALVSVPCFCGCHVSEVAGDG